MRTVTTQFSARRCTCGALLEPGMRRCRKCRARARWYRHKSRQSRRLSQHRAGTAPRRR